MNNAVTQSEFARLLGISRSYVTALKKADRLVLNAIGNVLVEESRKRIAETADPNRDDVGSRWAAQRVENPAVDDGNGQKKEVEESSKGDHDFQSSRAKKEHYLAEQARIQYERDIGRLIEKEEVAAAISDVVTTFRQALENLPHRTAPELVGKDLDSIRATLKQEVHGALAEMEREFTKRLDQVGTDE